MFDRWCSCCYPHFTAFDVNPDILMNDVLLLSLIARLSSWCRISHTPLGVSLQLFKVVTRSRIHNKDSWWSMESAETCVSPVFYLPACW
jgi:hypothetical protein